ncbi:MAG: PAS domain-containing protein [Rhodospirillales bacterium]
MDDIVLTGNERFFDRNEIIVSKTDLKGRLSYANEVFIDISGYTEPQLIGQPHSILRHPAMPRAVFKLLWDTIQEGREIFAYVVNRCCNGDHYWVLAHVTPSYGKDGQTVGYHSNRRVPDRKVITEVIEPLYRQMLDIENGHANRKEGMQAGYAFLADLLKQKNVHYDEFIARLEQ